MRMHRRDFMRNGGLAGGAWLLGALRDDWLQRLSAAEPAARGQSPRDIAGNEHFWFQIQQAFAVDRSIINLNNGGVCPSPRIVMEAVKRTLDQTNTAPARQLWKVLDPQLELVRRRLARKFGCDPEELAITRNASEALQIVLNGIDLKPGDEVLTSTQDYPRMLQTLAQRELRHGISVKKVRLPTPAKSQDELFEAFEQGVTPRTKALLVSQVTYMAGQILPVGRICEMARKRGIQTIVDGAHAFAQFPFTRDDIGCDYYGTSLHKWLTAPIGTGFLYVRKDRIRDLWPLTAPADPKSDNIRKFEEIGTHSDAPRLAIAEALTFYEGIGPERKAARLRFLRDYWAKRLARHEKVRFLTNLDPEHSCAIGTVGIRGVPAAKLVEFLWDKYKIIVTEIEFEDFSGIRVTPNVYTTTAELDFFGEAMERVITEGLPA